MDRPDVTNSAPHEPRPLTSSAFYLLFVLTFVATINWADRQVMPILFPALRRELGLTDTALGIVGGPAFFLVYALSSLAFGYAADRYLRKHVIALGLAAWSFTTAASGLAEGFWTLLAARILTGLGEASLYPCAFSLIVERVPAARRGRALGIVAAAAALGSGLGMGLGGRLAEHFGWRQVFFLYGGMGLVGVPLLLLLPEAPRTRQADEAESAWRAIRALLSEPRLLWSWACGTAAMASSQGFCAWMPSYLVRERGFEVGRAGTLFGGAMLIGGLLGGVFGGALSDRQTAHGRGRALQMPAWAALVSAVLVGLALRGGSVVWPVLGGALALLASFALFPALLSAILSWVPRHRQGAAAALNTLFLGGVGTASGPLLVGAVSEWTSDLSVALQVPAAGLLLACLLAVQAGRVARRQTGSAEAGKEV